MLQSLVSGHGFFDDPRSYRRCSCGSISASLNSPNNQHSVFFHCALSSLQSFTQCKVLFPATWSSSPVRLRKFISRGHKERSAWCCQQGKRNEVEKLWQEFFSNPSEWQDHRPVKLNPRFPDFQNQKTQQSLWLNCKWIPSWVEEKLAAMVPGTLKLSCVGWNRRLSNYAKTGQHKKTMELYEQMQRDGIDTNRYTFCPVLSACASLGAIEEGRRIHMDITQKGFESDLIVCSSLIDMYGKCGCMEDAERVFKQMHIRDVVAWSAMILGYVKCGNGQQALELYQWMQQVGVDPDPVIFMAVLNACASVGAVEEGRAVHEEIVRRGYETNVRLSNCLINMYCKCGRIEEAERVCKEMPRRDVVTWNTMILGYVKCGEGQEALELYRQMQREQVEPSPVTFVAVLKACASLAALDEGRDAHEEIIWRDYHTDVSVGNSLVDMYVKCGSIEDAERVFNQMSTRDVVGWTAMILGYVKHGEGKQALELYGQMQQERVDPDPFTFAVVLHACAGISALEEGRDVHEVIRQRGYHGNLFLGSSLVDMYTKCGSMEDAERVFNQMATRDVVAWNAMILGYVKCGEGQQALKLYQQMQHEGVVPDPVIFMAVLNACASVGAVEEGKAVHQEIVRRGYETNVCLSNCLVDMYCKCGRIEEAEGVFKEMPKRDVVTWNAMILGHVKCGEGREALKLYRQMQREQVEPSPVTFVAVLKACARIEAVDEGRNAHQEIIQRDFASNKILCNCLIDMYDKCGSIEDAERVFKRMHTRDVVSWSAMLAAYGRHGYAKEALEHFEQMCGVVEVNGVTFISLLTACSHGGLVDDGLKYFKSMSTVYNISPKVEHYACAVDLLGRANRLSEAEDLIMNMPMRPDATVWMSLLAACRVHINVEMGKRCAKELLDLEPENSAVYVLLAEICVAAGKREIRPSVFQDR